MNNIIMRDAGITPRVFLWNGPLRREELLAWAVTRGWVFPFDLVQFWCETGGGEVFESEVFLAPLFRIDSDDTVDVVTAGCRSRGLSADLVVFHEGLDGFTAVHTRTHMYTTVKDDGVSIGDEYPSLESWYVESIRREFAEKYGLPALD